MAYKHLVLRSLQKGVDIDQRNQKVADAVKTVLWDNGLEYVKLYRTKKAKEHTATNIYGRCIKYLDVYYREDGQNPYTEAERCTIRIKVEKYLHKKGFKNLKVAWDRDNLHIVKKSC